MNPRRPSISLLLSLCCLISLDSFTRAATPVVTAEYILLNGSGMPSFSPSDPTLRLAQTFTPLVAGILDGISVSLSESGTPLPSSVTVALYDTNLGQPSNELATATILAPALTSTPTLFTADFSSQNINLNTSDLYAIVLSPSPSGPYSWRGDNPGSYDGGNYFFSNNSGINWNDSFMDEDRGFRVTVIPEPTSALLLLLSTLGIAIRQRSQTTTAPPKRR